MPKYVYYAKNNVGEQKKGMVDAISEDVAVTTLQNHGLIVISLKSVDDQSALQGNISWLEGVSDRDMVIFSRLLATLLEVQVPLMEGLAILQGQTKNKYFQKVLGQAVADVEDGNLLSEALSKHPKVFSQLYVAMIQSGEASGSLQASLIFMADYLEEQYGLNSKIKGALIYPVFVLGIFLVIGLGVAYFVLPQLISVLEGLENVELPLATRMIIWISEFIQEYIIAIIVSLIVGVSGLVYFFKTTVGIKFWNKWQLKIPVFGSLYTKVYVARFASNMRTLLEGGIPILSALKISSDVVGNVIFQSIIMEAIQDMKGGSQMSVAFLRHEEFPAIASQIIQVGEKTARIESVLDTLTRFYKRDVDAVVDNLTTLIEPVMIVVLGVGVGIFVMAILMPIYNVTGSI